jgi:hypothetical protein
MRLILTSPMLFDLPSGCFLGLFPPDIPLHFLCIPSRPCALLGAYSPAALCGFLGGKMTLWEAVPGERRFSPVSISPLVVHAHILFSYNRSYATTANDFLFRLTTFVSDHATCITNPSQLSLFK